MSAIKFAERPGARRSTALPPTFETTYVLTGIFDSGTAKAFARGLVAPSLIVDEGIVYLEDIDCQEQGFELYYVKVRYTSQQRMVGQVGFSFTTTGGSFHITHSRESVAMYTTAGSVTPDNNRAINVNRTGPTVTIEGTDIIIPALKLTYTFRHPAGIINEAMAVRIARATSCVNSVAFRGFQPGEVIFLGADGSSGTATESEVAYHFACEENLTGLIFDAFDKDNPSQQITDVEKNGHDLLWIESGLTINDDSQPITKPKKIHVERLYNRINLAATLGWGG
jgi:hypothetical protein